MKTKTKIAFCWPEIPAYALRCINHLGMVLDLDIMILTTKPFVSFSNNDGKNKFSLVEVEPDNTISWEHLGLQLPDYLFVGSYKIPQFKKLFIEAHNNEIPIILMCDNHIDSIFYKLLSSIYHRLLLRKYFYGIFVPGTAGKKQARLWGYQRERIFTGLYGADQKIFNRGLPLINREKKIVFVGQFIERKNILSLTEAFIKFSLTNSEWELNLYGSGKLRTAIPEHQKIKVFDFAEPEKISNALKNSRCLVLPSKKEHWGVVVHEAVLSGCVLLLSNQVGALYDLASNKNSVIFGVKTKKGLYNALNEISAWEKAEWEKAESESIKLSRQFGPNIFSNTIFKIINH